MNHSCLYKLSHFNGSVSEPDQLEDTLGIVSPGSPKMIGASEPLVREGMMCGMMCGMSTHWKGKVERAF
jgi:hypothetical protein